MGRMVWTAAVKVGARRMQRQVPSSLVGLQTERDRLRAEYAMLAQRLGARLEEAKLRLAESMAEVSRHRNRIQQVESSEAERARRNAPAPAPACRSSNSPSRTSKAQRGRAPPGAGRQGGSPPQAAQEARLRRPQVPRTQPRRRSRLTRRPRNPPPPAHRQAERTGPGRNRAGRRRPHPADQPTPHRSRGKLAEAERQTSELERELQSLEAEWSTTAHRRTTAPRTEPATDGRQRHPPAQPHPGPQDGHHVRHPECLIRIKVSA